MTSTSLDTLDLNWAIQRLPQKLKDIAKKEDWKNSIFIGGGYLRSIVSGEPINDIDVFVKSKKDAEHLALLLSDEKTIRIETENAFTIKREGSIPIQVISRWTFDTPESVFKSFDFTICSAIVYFNQETNKWESVCDPRFYVDLAAKRLVYKSPERNEDEGGSLLRVLKYYQRGYRIPLDSLGLVIARIVKRLEVDKVNMSDEFATGKIITGLLVEVDPNLPIDSNSTRN